MSDNRLVPAVNSEIRGVAGDWRSEIGFPSAQDVFCLSGNWLRNIAI